MNGPAPKIDVPAPPARPRRRTWPLVLGLIALAFIGGPLLPYWYLATLADRELRDAVAGADHLDPGWRLEEIEAGRPDWPDQQNSAVRVLAVVAALPGSWPTWALLDADGAPATPDGVIAFENSLGNLPPPQLLTERQAAVLRAELTGAAPALAEARKLAEIPQGRFVVRWSPDYISTNLNHSTQSVRQVCRLLGYDAQLRAREGDADGALAACRAVVNAERSIGAEPTSISQLVRMAGAGLAVKAVERTLAQGEPSEAALRDAQRLLEREAAEPMLVAAFRGERAGQHGLLQALSAGEVKLSQIGGAPPTLDLFGASLARQSHAWTLRLLTEAVEIAKLPPEQQAERFARLEAKAREDPPMLGRMLLPALGKVAEAARRTQATLRCAVVGVAVERYRREHGRWPDSLARLVPAQLDAVPADPFDGGPLRYRLLPDGVVVYSVGLDSADNGGQLDRKDPRKPGTDLGFRLWDVAHRRQPQFAGPPAREPD